VLSQFNYLMVFLAEAPAQGTRLSQPDNALIIFEPVEICVMASYGKKSLNKKNN